MSAIFVLKNKPSVLYTDYFFYGLLGISILYFLILTYVHVIYDVNTFPYAAILGGLIGGGLPFYYQLKKRKPISGKKEILELTANESNFELKIIFNKTYSNVTCSFDEIKSVHLDDTFFVITLKNKDEMMFFGPKLDFKARKQLQELITKINTA